MVLNWNLWRFFSRSEHFFVCVAPCDVVCVCVLAWGVRSALGGRDPTGRDKPVGPILNLVGPVWVVRTNKPVRPVPEPVRPVWRQ
jgi:hypothetical protein